MLASLFLATTLALLVGCGGGGGGGGGLGGGGTGGGTTGGTSGGGISQTIAGTVATGDPVAGATVTIEDSSGKTFTGTKTAANGTFSIPVTGGKPPFMLVAVPTSGVNMYSVLTSMDMASTNTQNVNITTITTLVMYELSNQGRSIKSPVIAIR